MTPVSGPLTLPALAVLAAAAVAGWISALRFRALARRARAEVAAADDRERVFVAAARRLADAARESIDAVRIEIDRAVRSIAPGVDVVLFYEERDARLVCIAANGLRCSYFLGAESALDDDASILVAALRAGHHVIAGDGSGTPPLQPADAFGTAVPLVLDAGRRCVMYAAGLVPAAPIVADRIVRLVDGAAPAYRIALERAEDRARAEYDGLTGLVTARAFRAAFAQRIEAARARPLGRLGLLFVDTDRFKAWNDTYGHASGDALLRELARLLRAAAIADGDIIARNGGDEFCLVFEDSEKSRTVERAQRLCAGIAAADFTTLRPAEMAGEPVVISASIGVACFPADGATASDLLEQADTAMYHSKRTGRNGVSFYDADGRLVRAG